MDGRKNGWTDGWLSESMYEERIDKLWMDGGSMDRWMVDGWMDGWVCDWVDRCL